MSASEAAAAEPRSVLITGGNRGIGLATARLMRVRGDRVAVTYRSSPPPAEDILAVQADVTDTGSLQEAFAQVEQAHGPVEILVANAGITNDKLLLRMSEEDFTSVIDTNLTGAFRCVKHALPRMLRARKGRLIFISSISGFVGNPGQVNYAASKAALMGMARSLSRECAPRNVTANVIAPGFIETDMVAGLPEESIQHYRESIPAGRFGQADDVAATVHWLASEQAAYITGAVIPVDGGLSMGL